MSYSLLPIMSTSDVRKVLHVDTEGVANMSGLVWNSAAIRATCKQSQFSAPPPPCVRSRDGCERIPEGSEGSLFKQSQPRREGS